jgi:hypothetical protein
MNNDAGASNEERLKNVESQIDALMGHVKALEYGLRLMIATHPRPDVVLHALDRITDQARSPSLLSGDEPAPLYHAALRQGLEIIREQIVESAAPYP